jgi:Na+-translocating ferredoxin:NAD+ oxidoreductase RNF subunit RnfB
MAEEKDLKEKIKKIYEVLPKLDDQRCGFKTCGAFAKAVAEGKTPCYGCVTGGPEVSAKVCEIMGARIPAQASSHVSPSPGLYRAGLSGRRGIGLTRGLGRGMGLGRGRGRGQERGRRTGWGRGRGGR